MSFRVLLHEPSLALNCFRPLRRCELLKWLLGKKSGIRSTRGAAIFGERSSTFSAHPSWIPCAGKLRFAGSVLNAMLENRLRILPYLHDLTSAKYIKNFRGFVE